MKHVLKGFITTLLVGALVLVVVPASFKAETEIKKKCRARYGTAPSGIDDKKEGHRIIDYILVRWPDPFDQSRLVVVRKDAKKYSDHRMIAASVRF